MNRPLWIRPSIDSKPCAQQDILKVERTGGGYRLLVQWEGTDPSTNEPWGNSWEPRGNLARVAKKHVHIAQKSKI